VWIHAQEEGDPLRWRWHLYIKQAEDADVSGDCCLVSWPGAEGTAEAKDEEARERRKVGMMMKMVMRTMRLRGAVRALTRRVGAAHSHPFVA